MTLRRDDSTTDVEIHGLEVRNELQLIGRDKIALPGEEDPHCADSSARMARFAILSFVLGSLSWLLGPLSFVPAILFGHAARRQSTEHSGGVTLLAGLILGYSFLASAALVGALMVAGLLSREIDGFASLLEVWIGYCALGFVIAASVTCMYFAVNRPRFAIYGIALLLIGISVVSLTAMLVFQSRREARLNDQRDRLRRTGGALQHQQDAQHPSPRARSQTSD